MSKIKIIFLLVACLLISFASHSRSKVEIHFPGAENQKATVWTYTDLLSLDRIVLAELEIDNNGNLSFETFNSKVQKFYIEVRYFRLSLYVEPKKDYQMEVQKVDFSNRDFYPKNVVGYLSPAIRFNKPETAELNFQLDSLAIYFDDFIYKHHLDLRLGDRPWKLIDSLQIQVENYLTENPNPFLRSYTDIQFVQLRMLSNQYGNDYVVKTYFDPKKIDYSNPVFMSFFSSFWTRYIPAKLPVDARQKLDSVINKEQSYQALTALLAQDSLLANPALRELVILRNIPQLYQSEKYDQKALIQILYDISASRYSKEHQRMAVNIRKKLEALDNNNKAPDFEFFTSRNDTLNLERLKGKYIYIQFWDNECIDCISQMKFTKELYEKFDDVITFVHISLDRDEEDMKKLLAKYDYKWHFVFLEDNYQFLYNYQVEVLPRAILIDKSGKFIAWDARLPIDYFEDYFLKMLNDKKGNLQIRTDMRNGVRR